MPKTRAREKGTALFMTLAILFVVLVLTNIIVSFTLSQSRLTHHQVGRIQAYYAAQAAMNYAFEKLRTGSWEEGTNCTSAAPCTSIDTDPGYAGYTPALKNITTGFFPSSINYINVTIDSSAGSPIAGTYPVNITVDYQYAPTL